MKYLLRNRLRRLLIYSFTPYYGIAYAIPYVARKMLRIFRRIMSMKLCFWLFIVGIILIAVSALFGNGKIFIFLFFIPVFYGTGALAIIGALFIILSFSLIMINFMRGLVFEEEVARVKPETESRTRKWGGILFLGPIPIIFGSDRNAVIILIILALILIVVMSLFLLLWY